MTYLHQRCALICAGLLTLMILGSHGAITTSPSNKAVLKGASNVSMSCTSSTSFQSINWNYVPVGGSSEVYIATGPYVDARQNQLYAIQQSESQSNLIIMSATMARAGTYFCLDNEGQRAYAQLIIIDSNPMCNMTPNAPTELLYNQEVQMSCSISYTANTSYVTVDMIWSKEGSTDVVTSSTQNNTISNLITVVSTTTSITPGNFTPFPIYRCNTTFKLTGNLPTGSANIAPDYSKLTQLFSSPINVTYLKPADASSITGARDGDRVYLGTTVKCNVDANPTASYNWTDVAYGNTTNSPNIQIWHDGEFRCTAWNKAASTSVSVNFTTYSGLSDRDKIIIGVVVGVGGALLIVAVTILICCCLKKKNKADKYSGGSSEGTLSKPPPYDDNNGHRGPQRSSNPDLVQGGGGGGGYAMDDYPSPKQRSSLSSPYSTNSQQPYIDDEGLNYAQIQLDNNPRSRQPLQMAEETNYTDVRLA